MQQFPPEDLVRFLKKTDSLLSGEFELLIIGGAAACLAYGAMRTTTDIDLASQPPDELKRALEQAGIETGIDIPVQYVGVFDPPYNYEQRLKSLDSLKLVKLNILVPDQHDLALMKIVRGYENDIQAIEEMHQKNPLNMQILVDRFDSELRQVIGAPKTVKLNFLALVERLYGESCMEGVEEAIRDWPYFP